MDIILASASPRRKELLSKIFEDFRIIPADVDETINGDINTDLVPQYLSTIKAKAVAETNPNSLVISADTVVIHNNEILGKPKNAEDAKNMLNKLSGKAHFVITGCCIYYNGDYHSFSCKTKVTFYELSELEIKQYIATNECFDKAGAYGIQGYGSLLVKEIEGDYFNVVGLPVSMLNQKLKSII